MATFRIDLHSHCQGDPVDDLEHTIHEHIDRARACGLDVLALTWHEKIFADEAAIAYARGKGLLLIPGVETNLFGKYHTLVLNVKPGDIPGSSTLEDLRAVREKGDCFVMAPHPYYPYFSCLGSTIDRYPELFDGIEWCHYDFNWLPSWLSPNERARRWAQRHHKPLIAASDAHSLEVLGYFYSEIEAEELTVESVFAALRAGRVRFTPMPMSFRHAVRQSWGIVKSTFYRMIGR
jgi:predicted metal-dependent phosphoesterase TrpH